jgi:hypothetical protein
VMTEWAIVGSAIAAAIFVGLFIYFLATIV